MNGKMIDCDFGILPCVPYCANVISVSYVAGQLHGMIRARRNCPYVFFGNAGLYINFS